MNGIIPDISATDLAWVFVPAIIVIAILFRWSLEARTAIYAVARMLIQLILIGYVLTYIF